MTVGPAPSTGASRAFLTGDAFTADGSLVASLTQEGLLHAIPVED